MGFRSVLNKKNIVIVLILLLFIVSGCTQFDVNLGIDSNNTAYLSYQLEIDISGFDERQQHNFKVALHEIAIHYQNELNFSIHLDIESNPIVLIAEKRIANDSFEQAFESLRSMLTDMDMSIFMQVDMDSIIYPRQAGYVVGAIADIPRIIKSQDADNLPPEFQAGLDDAIQTSRGTITVSLPADEWVNASHSAYIDGGQVVMAVPLSFSDQTAFELSAVLNMLGSGADGSVGAIIEQQLHSMFGTPGESAIEQQQQFRNIAMMVTVAAAGLIVLTLIVTIVVVIVKKLRIDN